MTIGEVEQKTGLERANIRFYEKEGMVAPRRLENGYRDYSQEDVQMLLRIKLLRSLHISLEEIRELQSGRRELTQTLSDQRTLLDMEIQNASYAKEICRVMQEDRVTFAGLDAQKYLEHISAAAQETGNHYFEPSGDTIPQVYHPWRRYFARMFDLTLYETIWMLILWLGFHQDLTIPYLGSWTADDIVTSIAAMLLMLFLEPVFLHVFTATPGKAIFGLHLETAEGERLSYGEGLHRTGRVLVSGMGLLVPVVSLWRLWKSFRVCRENETLPWDEREGAELEQGAYYAYSIKDTGSWRSVCFVAVSLAWIGILFGIFFLSHESIKMPPNRGELTIAEFAENFNYYAKMQGGFEDWYLDEQGKWKEDSRTYSDYAVRIDWFDMGETIGEYTDLHPEFVYETNEDGYLTSVSFVVEDMEGQKYIRSYFDHMLTISLAYGAAADKSFISSLPDRIAEEVSTITTLSYGVDVYRTKPSGETVRQAGDLEIRCLEEANGYRAMGIYGMSYGMAQPDMSVEDRYYRLEFFIYSLSTNE